MDQQRLVSHSLYLTPYMVSRAKHKTDPLSLWINRLVAQRGHNKACVAYANKMARMAWAITVSGEQYQPA
ncbi:hypothetical protein [Paraneptunicella aestuarii]|uniref:hypothetical protein n=1 Tax=Paraneptunicella aestuarii TaxID=2831148 RepID=UPI001E500EE9|nr:hypothetical protein [Paraneptunicella aestuarii]